MCRCRALQLATARRRIDREISGQHALESPNAAQTTSATHGGSITMNPQIPVPSRASSSTWIRPTWIKSTRRISVGRRASFAVLGLAVLLNGPSVALATPPNGFASDITKTTFDWLRIIYGQDQKNDP